MTDSNNPSPHISSETLAHAEKIIGLSFTDQERDQILRTLDRWLATRDVLWRDELENATGPAEDFDPCLPDTELPAERRASRWSRLKPGPLPRSDEDIAFAPVGALAHWLKRRELTSERLTEIYLARLEKFGPSLECVVNITADLARRQARRADEELSRGRSRGPLHGIPWGAKDIIDTRGIETTWGAEPFRGRVPAQNAAVADRLERAGAVLVAKLSVGALAYGDLWYGGKTRNPWKLEEGSRGSSAGSAAAVTAGLVGFSLGSETYGSIASPAMRCGATGFRPTFGRVSRHGVMALAWSLDKIGSLTRTVDDSARVLDAIAGRDPRDRTTKNVPLNLDMSAMLRGMRVGYVASEFESDVAGEADRQMLDQLRGLGLELTAVTVPEEPYREVLLLSIQVEAAAAFDALTRYDRDDELKWQEDLSWPNTFRRTRFVPAVDYLQARRLRRKYMRQASELFRKVDLVVAPRRHEALHALTNLTGQPALTIRQQFMDDGTPRGVTLWGRLYHDATLLRVGAALEEELGLWSRRPPLREPGQE